MTLLLNLSSRVSIAGGIAELSSQSPGELSATITVQVVGDLLEDPDETFFVRI